MLGSGQTRHWEGDPQVPDLSSFDVTMENIEPQEKLLCLYNIPILVKIQNDLSCISVIHGTDYVHDYDLFFVYLYACVSHRAQIIVSSGLELQAVVSYLSVELKRKCAL